MTTMARHRHGLGGRVGERAGAVGGPDGPPVTKVEGWPERLALAIEAAAERPFSWPEHNCGLFVADCVAAMTGTDPAGGFLRDGRFADRTSARVAVRIAGGKGGSVGAFAAGIAKAWGAVRVDPAFAQRGDVAAVRQGREVALGIVWIGHVLVVTPEGMGRLPLSAATRVWRIAD